LSERKRQLSSQVRVESALLLLHVGDVKKTNFRFEDGIFLGISVMESIHQRWRFSQSAQDSGFGTLQGLGANVNHGPIEHSTVLFRRKRQNLHLRIPADEKTALGRTFVGVVQREYQYVGPGLLNRHGKFVLILDFANNLDVVLVG
jgi:hypothetical protein